MLSLRTVGKDIHLVAVLRVTTDMPRNRSLILLKVTPHKGDISTLCRVEKELAREVVARLLILAYNKYSRGIFINSVYKSCALIALLEHRIILQVECERIDKRAVVVSMSWVYTHTCLLIYNNHIVILIDNINRNILRCKQAVVLRILHLQHNLIKRLNLIRRLLRTVVHKDISLINSRLHTISRAVFDMRCKILIQTHHRLTLIYRNREVLIESVLVGLLVGQKLSAGRGGDNLLVIQLYILYKL